MATLNTVLPSTALGNMRFEKKTTYTPNPERNSLKKRGKTEATARGSLAQPTCRFPKFRALGLGFGGFLNVGVYTFKGIIGVIQGIYRDKGKEMEATI